MLDLSSLFSAIDDRVKQVESPFATFDFDGTCLWDSDCEELMQFYLYSQGKLRNPYLLDPAGEKMDEDYHKRVCLRYFELMKDGAKPEAYDLTKRCFEGFTPQEFENLMHEVIAWHGDAWETYDLWGHEVRKGIKLHPNIERIMDYCREKGVQVNIVSAAAENCLIPCVNHILNNKFDHRYGVRMKFDSDGRIINEYEEPSPIFGGKVKTIQYHIHPTQKPILAAGDSMGDEKMLEYSDIKVVVDHHNKLAQRAKKESWFLIDNL